MTDKPTVAVASGKGDLEALAAILKGSFNVIFIGRPELLAAYMETRRPDIVVIDGVADETFSSIRDLKPGEVGGTSETSAFAIIDDPDARRHVFKAGLSGYLLKPFQRLDVIAQLTRQLSLQQAHAALRLENVHLEKIVEERVDDLSESRMQIITSLGRAAEFRDNETGLHVVRMSKISRELALGLGLDADTADLLMQAAPMHDVGKIGIPDDILLKPGKLDDAEWTIMKKHPALGASILGKGTSRLLYMARTVAAAHHEKWDGSGYPRGIEKNDIPLEARIVTVADIFDALTSKRPYKDAWPAQQAVEYINSQADRALDRRIVDAFNSRIAEIQNISEIYAD